MIEVQEIIITVTKTECKFAKAIGDRIKQLALEERYERTIAGRDNIRARREELENLLYEISARPNGGQ